MLFIVLYLRYEDLEWYKIRRACGFLYLIAFLNNHSLPEFRPQWHFTAYRLVIFIKVQNCNSESSNIEIWKPPITSYIPFIQTAVIFF